MTKKLFFILLLFFVIPKEGLPQQTAVHAEPEVTFKTALELFSKEHYGPAQRLFRQLMDAGLTEHRELLAGAQLHAALCAAELQQSDAEEKLLTFLKEHPVHQGQMRARFHLGIISHKRNDYAEASKWFEPVRAENLPKSKYDQFHFKSSHSLLMNGRLTEAADGFLKITDPSSDYFTSASYYYGHIAYLEGAYDTALERFEALTGDAVFSDVVPYYIAHIYFLEQRFDELLDMAPGLLDEAAPERIPELSRLIGEAYIEKSRYEEAIPYLLTFFSSTDIVPDAGDHYQLGFAFFITGNFENAIPHLEMVTAADNALAQNAYFHLGYSYVQTGQKRFARNAFMQAHQMPYLEDIARESLFHYAMLSFELSYDPYNEAILSFNRYLEQYPDSPRREEAYGHLVDLYLTTRNYKDALASLEKTQHDTRKLREAYQRVTYFRGVELFNNGDFRNAIEHFSKTQRYTDNRELSASALFWTGEAFFRMGQYDDALSAHRRFLSAPGSSSLDFHNQSHYSIGYAFFKKEDYSRAIPPFSRFISSPGSAPAAMVNDAVLRVADAHFITKAYQQAMRYYERAITMNIIDTDYAVFQKGLVYGILGRFEEKIATMQELISEYPNSSFIDDGRYEIANTYLILENNTEAKNYFGQVISRHPNSTYVQSAMLKTGLIHYNDNRDEEALAMFMQVIEKFPATVQAQEALAAMQTIYVGLDRIDEYVQLTERLGIADISRAQQDSLTYQAAEHRYMQGDCNAAIQSFSNYLERFPEGIFAINANFYRSECYFRMNELQRAYEGYRFVAEASRSKFLENALLRASAIQFQFEQYAPALRYYQQLEQHASFRNNILIAREGIMRSYYRMRQHEEVLTAALAVINTEKIPRETEQEAYLLKGLSALELNNYQLAGESLRQAKGIAENIRAAEAMYALALISFKQGNYEEAEEEIFSYINRLTAYDYWLAKIFLLLADVYLEKDNAFQAKHTLQSIIDNYDGEELRREAKNKLDLINERQNEPALRGSQHPEETE
ncbi:MAG: tetratricopeptide repeat protein [Bacteroidales bacterium]|nr:tetratricopeptide repeat protein [Bacteroidales bacterium]